MNKDKWFVYTNEDGIDFYDSEQEAKNIMKNVKNGIMIMLKIIGMKQIL